MSNDSNEPEVARVCFSGLFQDTWDIFMEKIGLFALMGLVLTIILGGMMFAGMLVSWVSTLLVLLPQVDSGGGGLHGLTSADILVPLIVVLLFNGVLWMVVSLVHLWIYGGQLDFQLAVVRGQDAKISMLFQGVRHFVPLVYLVAAITIVALCTFAFFSFLSLIPTCVLMSCYPDILDTNPVWGVVFFVGNFGCIGVGTLAASLLMFMYGFSYFFLVDRGGGGSLEYMKQSWKYLRPHFWPVLGMTLVLSLLSSTVGSIAGPFAMIVTLPFMSCFYTVAYLRMTGQKTLIDDKRAASPVYTAIPRPSSPESSAEPSSPPH